VAEVTLEAAIAERGDINDVLTTAFWREKRIVVLRILHSFDDGFSVVFVGENYSTSKNFRLLLDLLRLLQVQLTDDPSYTEARDLAIWVTHTTMLQIALQPNLKTA
jgi:hypothetical protein